MKISPIISMLLLPALVLVGHRWPGPGDYLLPFCCFIVHPLAGLLLPRRLPAPVHTDDATEGVWFRVMLIAFVPILLGLTSWAIHEVVTRPELPIASFIGLILSIGTLNGVIGFTVAHECIHHHNTIDRIAGKLILLQNGYLHYAVEHLYGHHVYGCTPEDPHTARLGETLYAFLGRSVLSTWRNAWSIENRLGKKRAGHGIHQLISALLLQTILYVGLAAFFGPKALLFLAAQSCVAIFLLHSVDYLQHYGLMRREIAPGKYERTAPMHAWATGDHISQFNLFQLDKHADHHLHPSRHYEQLVAYAESPQFPMSYAGMILLALFPKAWFQTVNPLITPTKQEHHEA